MAKFSQLARPKLARKPVEFTTLDGQKVTVAVVPLIGATDADVLGNARSFAKTHGVEDPKPGEPLYERGLALYTVLLTTMDPDVVDRNEQFFASAEEINKYLDPDRIAVLFNAQRAWQAEVAPQIGSMTELEFISHTIQLADAAMRQERGEGFRGVPFDGLPLATQLRFTRILASRFASLVYAKSPTGSDSQDTGESSSGSSSPPTTQPPPESSPPSKSSPKPSDDLTQDQSPAPSSPAPTSTPSGEDQGSSGGDA